MVSNPSEAAVSPKTGLLKTLGGMLSSVGGIATTTVGLASALFSCSADNIKRNDAFVSDVAANEKQWQQLYDQYFAALASKDSEPVVLKRLLAICEFTEREVPAFKEHALGHFWVFDDQERQATAARRIARLKQGLVNTLAEDGVVQGVSRCEKVQEEEVAAAEAEVRERIATPASPRTPPSATVGQIAATKQQVRASGTQLNQLRVAPGGTPPSVTVSAGNPRGYDIDVFWCRGAGESDRVARGTALAKALASRENNRMPDNTLIGRVRLRPLSLANQADPDYPSSGFQVRADEAELGFATSLASFLSANTSGVTFLPKMVLKKTPWYLSVFICS